MCTSCNALKSQASAPSGSFKSALSALVSVPYKLALLASDHFRFPARRAFELDPVVLDFNVNSATYTFHNHHLDFKEAYLICSRPQRYKGLCDFKLKYV